MRRRHADGCLESRPGRRQARGDDKDIAFATNTENALQARAVHPACGARVPGPTTASFMWRNGVHIRGDDIGFDLVAFRFLPAESMIDGVEQREQVGRLVALSQCCIRQDGPHRGMAVLAAIFPESGRIATDIARIMFRLVERRPEQQCQPGVHPDQFFLHRPHGECGTLWIGRAGQHRPGLGNRINATLIACMSPQPGAVIVGRTSIPLTIPGMLFEGFAYRLCVGTPTSGARLFAASLLCEGHEKRQGAYQQPPQPHALALAGFPYTVHAIVPVTPADQWQTMLTRQRQALIETTSAMLI